MPKKTPPTKRARLWRLAATLVLIAAAVYLLSTHWQTVRNSSHVLRTARPQWILLGLGCTVVTFGLAAAIYRLLALKAVRYRQLLVVELAAAFANRLLPAGLGGLSLHGLYLFRRGHSAAQATAVVSVNNLLGIAAHLCLLALLLIVSPETLRHFGHHGLAWHWWYGAVAIGLIVILLLWPALRRKLARFARNLLTSLRLLRTPHVVGAALAALLLTTTYTTVLFASAHAVGIGLNLLQIFIVFSIGMLAGTATPTPGGLVGAEAGLFAGFVGYGVADTTAAAAVLLYRLLTYWLPLVPGLIALLSARAYKLV